jgi:hypothetical protein
MFRWRGRTRKESVSCLVLLFLGLQKKAFKKDTKPTTAQLFPLHIKNVSETTEL